MRTYVRFILFLCPLVLVLSASGANYDVDFTFNNVGSCGSSILNLCIVANGLFQQEFQAVSVSGAHSTGHFTSGTSGAFVATPGVTYSTSVVIGSRHVTAGQSMSLETSPHAEGGLVFVGTISGTNTCVDTICSETNYIYSFTATNHSSDYVMWVAVLNGSPVCGSLVSVGAGQTSGGSGAQLILAPGATGTMTTPAGFWGCGDAPPPLLFVPWTFGGWSQSGSCVVPLGASGGGGFGPTGILQANSGAGAGGSGIGGNSGVGGGGGQPTYQATNTSGIVFDPTNSPGGSNGTTDATSQQGFAALYDAVNRNGAATVGQLVSINAELLQGNNALFSISNQMGTLTVQESNASNLLVSVTNQARIWGQENTNILRSIANYASNAIVVNTNGLVGVSNAVVAEQNLLTNWFAWTGQSNILNTTILSNAMYGISNAQVMSLTNLMRGLTNLASVMTNALGGISANTNSSSGTNSVDISGVTNSIRFMHVDVTNLLGRLTDTNNGAYARIAGLSDLAAEFTNSAAAKSITDGLIGSGMANIDSYGADADALSAGFPAGGAPVFTIAFAGTTLNLDPDAIIPGATSFVFYLVELVVLILFYISASKLYMDTMANLGKLQTGGVPNLMAEVFGIGGNLLGLAVHPAICLAIVTLWVGVLTAFLGRLPTAGMLATALGHVGSSGGAAASGAYYLINATMPVSLMLSLAGTRIGLQFMIGNLILSAAAIMRFFIGK